MTGSLAYRTHEAAILRGDVPAKYTRLLPFIPDGRVLEMGSAEGVLSLLMAREGRRVTALEASPERHAAALHLRDTWLTAGVLHSASKVEHICGRAQAAAPLIEPDTFDTLVAVRMIYYLRDDIDAVFAEVATKIPNVVLCGNQNRAAWYAQGIPDKSGGPVNRYASADGMIDLLERHGYEVMRAVHEGDPIVVGRKDI